MAIVLTPGDLAPAITYASLKGLIADHLHRSDLTDRIPGWISLAEAFLFRELSIAALEVVVLGVTDGGLIALPDDCASVGRVTLTHALTERALDYSAVAPASYTLEAGGLRLDSRVQGQAYALYYTPRLVPLSDAHPVNWLLIHAPDLYLAAAQLEGARYMQDADQIASLSGVLPALLDSVQRLTRRTGQPMRGGLQIKPRGAR